jgi:hypothetical protein
VPTFENRWAGFFAVEVLRVPEAVSPKFQVQDVGEPDEVSVNCSVRRAPVYATENDATGSAARTVTYTAVEPLPAAFVAVRCAVYVPAAAYVWDGFFAVDEDPSPKLQLQAVGELLEASVNCTTCPTVGGFGEKANPATGTLIAGAVTVIVFVVPDVPAALVAVRRIV